MSEPFDKVPLTLVRKAVEPMVAVNFRPDLIAQLLVRVIVAA